MFFLFVVLAVAIACLFLMAKKALSYAWGLAIILACVVVGLLIIARC